MEKLRVFLGIGPAEPSWAKELNAWVAALKQQLEERGENLIRWIPAENLHLTLRFFGAMPRNEIIEVSERIAPIVAERKSFVLETSRLALFPNPRRARVAAIELNDSSSELLKLEDEIRRATREFGQAPEDRTFRAHVTFGRIKESRGLASLWNHTKPPKLPPWPVNELKLFMSELQSSGSVYTPLATFLLPSVLPQL